MDRGVDTLCDSSTKGGLTEETLSRRCRINENTKLKRKEGKISKSTEVI